MTLPLYHTLADAPTPASIFTRAQAAWNARGLPPYESFTLPCSATFLANLCSGDVRLQFIVRLADGRTMAQTIDANGKPGSVLLRDGFIFGPAGAPFGFYRRTPALGVAMPSPPPNLAADPIGTITTVTAVDRAYDITLAGTETVRGYTCWHLRLRPLRDPQQYRLRELWIDEASYEVVRLVYAQPFNATTAMVTYDFAPAGAQNVWSIVHIAADAGSQHVDEDLDDITFPANAP
jgi:hypothetical protein